MILLMGGTIFASGPQGAAQDVPASQYTKPPEVESKAKAEPADDAAKPKASNASSAVDPDYRIGLGDQLTITVWKEPEMSGNVVVRSDGMITLPLLNDIRVVGL